MYSSDTSVSYFSKKALFFTQDSTFKIDAFASYRSSFVNKQSLAVVYNFGLYVVQRQYSKTKKVNEASYETNWKDVVRKVQEAPVRKYRTRKKLHSCISYCRRFIEGRSSYCVLFLVTLLGYFYPLDHGFSNCGTRTFTVTPIVTGVNRKIEIKKIK
jgi:hypothetical protein